MTPGESRATQPRRCAAPLDAGLALTSVGTFVAWIDDSLAGHAGPRDLELWSLDDQGQPIVIRLLGAEVQRIMNGKGNTAMTEEIEMVIERLERG